MRAASRKRAARLRIYNRLRDEYLAAHPHCERCGRFGTELHHKRGRVGPLLCAVEFFAALCPGCHRWATEHPRAAIESGWSLRRVS